jgi:hypothetical protein
MEIVAVTTEVGSSSIGYLVAPAHHLTCILRLLAVVVVVVQMGSRTRLLDRSVGGEKVNYFDYISY